MRNLEQNAAAANLELSAAEVCHLIEVFAIGAGERYNPRLLEKWGI